MASQANRDIRIQYRLIGAPAAKAGIGSVNAELEKTGLIASASLFLVGASMSALGGAMSSAIDGVTESFSNTNAALVNLNKFLPDDTDMAPFLKAGQVLAVQFGRNLPEVIDGMAVWAQVTGDTAEIIDLQRKALLLAVVGEMDAAEATRVLVGITQQFGLELSASTEIVDGLNNASNRSGVTIDKLQRTMLKAGGAARQAKVSWQELTGMAVALNKAQVGAEEAGTSLKTLLSKLVSDQAIEQLRSVGIEVELGNGKLKGATEILAELAPLWNDLSDEQRKNIAISVGGFRQISKLNILLNSWELAMEGTANALDAEGSAAEEAEKVLNSFEKRLERVTAAQNNLATVIGENAAPSVLFMAKVKRELLFVTASLPKPLQMVAFAFMAIGGSIFQVLGPMFMMIAQLPTLINMMRGLTLQTILASGAFRFLLTSSIAILALWLALTLKGKKLKFILFLITGALIAYNIVAAFRNALDSFWLSLTIVGLAAVAAGVAGSVLAAGASAQAATDARAAGAGFNVQGPSAQTSGQNFRRILRDGPISAHAGEIISRAGAVSGTIPIRGGGGGDNLFLTLEMKPFDASDRSMVRKVVRALDEFRARRARRKSIIGASSTFRTGVAAVGG